MCFVLKHDQRLSVTTVQREFRRLFRRNDVPTHQDILRWYRHRQFTATGSLLKRKSYDRQRLPPEITDVFRQRYELNKQQSVRSAGLLGLPKLTVQNLLRKHYELKPYRQQLLQKLNQEAYENPKVFCNELNNFLEDNQCVRLTKRTTYKIPIRSQTCTRDEQITINDKVQLLFFGD